MAAASSSLSVNYNEFFKFPHPPLQFNNDCIAECKLCNKTFKYSLTSKGNLHHHLSVVHPEKVKKFLESNQIPRDQATIESTAGNLKLRTYNKQKQVTKSFAQHLIAQGGLPVSVVEQNWFRSFLNEVLPNYQIPSRETIWKTLEGLANQSTKILLEGLNKAGVRPSLTVDLWTGRNHKLFISGAVHFPGKY